MTDQEKQAGRIALDQIIEDKVPFYERGAISGPVRDAVVAAIVTAVDQVRDANAEQAGDK